MKARIIRIADIASTPSKPGILPVSPATIWRWVRDGKFPQPLKLSAGVTAWRANDIEQFIADSSPAIA
ncbi:AlpA family phage regulatory protein [Pseudoduganella sp. FT93W]|uniref:AlpA family phage regulatory protein n=1 Tax=Duganella fentianensis TaxID=2692177 RepID=A0A845I2R8_9BURK|nr:AlpA family phage regulatory protein [Duganella fentianensis]MYN47442.1 AlpA family phage regulatory protein [Duganella fentianensis]